MSNGGIPIEELFPGAEYIPPGGQEGTMDHTQLRHLKNQYTAERNMAVSNLKLVEAEGKRLNEVILRLEGAMSAVEEMEKVLAEQPEPESKPEPEPELPVPLGMKKPIEFIVDDDATEAEAVSGAIPTCELPQEETKEN